jgi:hypothetical protein
MNGQELGIAAGACLAAVALLLVLLTVAGRRRVRRRWAELRRWAGANGWTLVSKPVVDWGSRLPGGNKHGVSFALYGEMWDRPCGVGEYSFSETRTTSTRGGNGGTTIGTTTTTHQYVVVVLHLDRPSAYLGVQPRSVLSRWGHTLFGLGSSIGHERFDKQFRVVGDPPAAAYPLSSALVAAHVEGTVPPWTLYGADLMTWYPGRIDLARVPALVGPLRHVATMLTGADAAR